jgi:hypothetical protein
MQLYFLQPGQKYHHNWIEQMHVLPSIGSTSIHHSNLFRPGIEAHESRYRRKLLYISGCSHECHVSSAGACHTTLFQQRIVSFSTPKNEKQCEILSVQVSPSVTSGRHLTIWAGRMVVQGKNPLRKCYALAAAVPYTRL